MNFSFILVYYQVCFTHGECVCVCVFSQLIFIKVDASGIFPDSAVNHLGDSGQVTLSVP